MSGSNPMSAGRGGPADHGWKRAGGTADDDVLWRVPLQPYRVHDGVEEDREGEQRCRRNVERDDRERQPRCRRERVRTQALLGARSCREGSGRNAVRTITASMSASYHMLSTPAAPAPDGDREHCNATRSWIEMTRRNVIPTNAVNTART